MIELSAARVATWTCRAVCLMGCVVMNVGGFCQAQTLPNAGGSNSALIGFTGLVFSVGECNVPAVGAGFICGQPGKARPRLSKVDDTVNNSGGRVQVFDATAGPGRSLVFSEALGSSAGDPLLNFALSAAIASPRERPGEIDPISAVNRALKQQSLDQDSFDLKLSRSETTFAPLSRAVINTVSGRDDCDDLLHVSAQLQVIASVSMDNAEASLGGSTMAGLSFGTIPSLSIMVDLGLNDPGMSDGDRLVLANDRHRAAPAR